MTMRPGRLMVSWAGHEGLSIVTTDTTTTPSFTHATRLGTHYCQPQPLTPFKMTKTYS